MSAQSHHRRAIALSVWISINFSGSFVPDFCHGRARSYCLPRQLLHGIELTTRGFSSNFCTITPASSVN